MFYNRNVLINLIQNNLLIFIQIFNRKNIIFKNYHFNLKTPVAIHY
jgi:hypothetical protein